MKNELHTAMVSTGTEICPHDPPCHPPVPWLQLLAYATINDVVIEVVTTLRAVER